MSGVITVLGLGAGELDQLTMGVYKKIKEASHMYVRTKEHPVIEELEKEGIQYTAFDHIYEAHDTFEIVYETIVKELLEKAQNTEIIYAVPGHPLVAERTVQLLLEKGKQEQVEIRIEGGQSFLDPMFSSLKIDPIEGFQFVDATSFERGQLELRHHLIFCQVYDVFVASDVKLTLMEMLPDEYEVYIVTAAGTSFEEVKKVPLYMLDHETRLNNLTSVYVPPVKERKVLYQQFDVLREIIAELRGPNGCPWDKKQTHQSLKKYLIEEAYEVLEAIDEEDDDHLVEELGDVLLQVMLHAQIGEDEGWFSIDDIIQTLSEKMVRRHPHVFGEVDVKDEEDVLSNWEEIKKKEKGNVRESVLAGIPKGLPQLMRAYEIQKKAGKVGFDWADVQPMKEKALEEWEEFQQEVEKMDREKMLGEFGDVLFAFVNIARYYNLNPEEALHVTNEKFMRRFLYMEAKIAEMNKEIQQFTLEQLDVLWEEAKQVENK
ncbi:MULTISPECIES: nucleoside triphosphate pyrophosphohydrolase [Bacillus cereus group]|uniref:MazG family protein n=3 Tax=Bacillus cytotoxicus TaxID=580165 RepID=A7GJW8_BACCN|nr:MULTISPECIES: nucleoside triphosphate pyrophosphohydrolase [Bacillus cereus group]ABS20426.1 MazG family protein [Bacillus cytotoxicus NVH 391-98]AWC30757.1 nucleoside triphosphate pyrophosphohydrolase [Bacillus cytotoxicus]AWC34817.1 nucleoside triphosphate pyrophosphohydrolase [Bacillus cytotoxicus]AWC38811.1 nucleoside triphosphate pyrophosphohydrolase [Bacillus cytotoxicus]AWC42899.1 nucleoside triphosphate pyrophosphohydrolase [Bacillus cytotoxicus]